MIRRFCFIGFCGVIALILLANQSPTEAQGGKKEDLAKANQQIQQLQKSVKEKEQHINKLEAKINQFQQRINTLETDAKKKKGTGEKSAQLQKDLDKANLSIKDKDQLIATLKQSAPKATVELTKEVEKLRGNVRTLESVKQAPFVHTRILKLKKTDDEQVKKVAEEAGKTLAKITGVRGMWIGKPAENGTPELAQKDFQLGVIVLLDDADALQKFLDDPLHKQFNEKLADLWERPIVYDIQRDPAPATSEEPKKKDTKKKKDAN